MACREILSNKFDFFQKNFSLIDIDFMLLGSLLNKYEIFLIKVYLRRRNIITRSQVLAFTK